MNQRAVGAAYEQTAVEYLQGRGYRILERNFHAGRFGEIDIIAQEKGTVVFVEVKYRKSNSAGDPAQAVTRSKQVKICRVADFYLKKEGYRLDTPCRFDVISILGEKLQHIENAFEYLSC